ncbi:MAG: hypothetical protein BWZ03_00353 [bacterium ADurb.BinA186]|nr:MAG: hypothetical protein BWZ03_00353 [bacterium ADurb.BinA186]
MPERCQPGLDVVAIAPNPVNADEAVILNNRGLQLLRISEGRFIPLHEFLFGKTDCLDFACIPGEYPEYYVCLSNSQSIWKISTDPLTVLKETPFASGFTDLRGIAYSEQRNQFAVADGARILMLKADGAVFQEIPIENSEIFTLEAVAATNNGDFFLLGKAL